MHERSLVKPNFCPSQGGVHQMWITFISTFVQRIDLQRCMPARWVRTSRPYDKTAIRPIRTAIVSNCKTTIVTRRGNAGWWKWRRSTLGELEGITANTYKTGCWDKELAWHWKMHRSRWWAIWVFPAMSGQFGFNAIFKVATIVLITLHVFPISQSPENQSSWIADVRGGLYEDE